MKKSVDMKKLTAWLIVLAVLLAVGVTAFASAEPAADAASGEPATTTFFTTPLGSALLIVVSIAVLVLLVMKGVNLIPAALAAGAILAFGVAGGWINAIFTTFSSGAGAFAKNLLVPFMSGGIFGAIMIGSGSDVVIGRTIIKKFGTGFAVYSLAVFVAIMGFAGINSWPFLAAILAFSLMRACDLPLNVACVTMVGINSAFSFIFPGSPTMPNLIASQAFGTNIYAGAGIGIVMCVVQCVLVLLYVNYGMIRKYRAAGVGYTATPMETSLRGDEPETAEEDLPSFAVAIIPMATVVILACVFQLGLGMESTPACVIAQVIASVLCVILNFKRGIAKKLPKAVSNGCIQTSWPMLATCAVVGFAALISSTTFYTSAMAFLTNLNISPYVLVVVGTAIAAAIGADPMSGISLSASTFGQTAIAAGANAGLVHRLTLASATTFDSMPHSGNLNVTMGFLGLTHKDVYKQIVVVQIGATSVATLVGMVISMIIG